MVFGECACFFIRRREFPCERRVILSKRKASASPLRRTPSPNPHEKNCLLSSTGERAECSKYFWKFFCNFLNESSCGIGEERVWSFHWWKGTFVQGAWLDEFILFA